MILGQTAGRGSGFGVVSVTYDFGLNAISECIDAHVLVIVLSSSYGKFNLVISVTKFKLCKFCGTRTIPRNA